MCLTWQGKPRAHLHQRPQSAVCSLLFSAPSPLGHAHLETEKNTVLGPLTEYFNLATQSFLFGAQTHCGLSEKNKCIEGR